MKDKSFLSFTTDFNEILTAKKTMPTLGETNKEMVLGSSYPITQSVAHTIVDF